MLRISKKLFFFGFSSSDEEFEFRTEHLNPSEIRRIVFSVMAFYSLYSLLDHYVFPEYFRMLLIIRIGLILPVLLFLFFLTFSKNYYRYTNFIIIGYAVACAAGIIIIEYITRESVYSELYFYGIAQVLIVFYGTGKVNFAPSIIGGLLIIIPAIIMDSIFIESDIIRITIRSIFMSTLFMLGVIVSLIIQYTARTRYLSHKEVEVLSLTDSLTGLKNRLYYDSIIIDEINCHAGRALSDTRKRAERATDNIDNCDYVYILLDIDHFKLINDRYGHDAGDMVLKELAQRILRVIRTNDSFIRWGGEEFLLLLRYTREDYLENLVKKIREVISTKPFEIDDQDVRITVSGGICMIPPKVFDSLSATTAESIFSLTDKALYHSKENGRDCFTEVTCSGNEEEKTPKFKII